MKTRKIVQVVCAGALCFGLLGTAAAQDKGAAGKGGGMDPKMAEMMKKAEANATPGEQHKWLAKAAGKWTVASKWWMDPKAPPMESKGTAEFSMILNGLYLKQDYAGEMMGKPFKGMGLNGYDHFRKQFTSLWIDDASSQMMTAYGTADKDGKSVTFNGTMDDPMMGKKNMKVKMVIAYKDDTTMTWEMWTGKMKMGEMTYTRAK